MKGLSSQIELLSHFNSMSSLLIGVRRRNMCSMSDEIFVTLSKHNLTESNGHGQHYGPYASVRESLDYSYHSTYTKERQALQDEIIDGILGRNTPLDQQQENQQCSCEYYVPWAVFTAGAMGAGKSHTLKTLHRQGRLPLDHFVRIDPDEIRRHLPEYEHYVRLCPRFAGALTSKESGLIAEIATKAALRCGKSVLVDGSLRDSAWYAKHFADLRNEFPLLRIAIIHVSAPTSVIFQRALARGLATGRQVPPELIHKTLEEVPRSIEILKGLTDYFCELRNDEGESLTIVTPGETWESFQKQWSCVTMHNLALTANSGRASLERQRSIRTARSSIVIAEA